MSIIYKINESISVEKFIDLLHRLLLVTITSISVLVMSSVVGHCRGMSV